MVETRVDAKGVNVTAYAVKTGSGIRVAIVNKDEQQAIRVTLNGGIPAHEATLWRLAAPGVESKTGVRLAGAEVSADGGWSAREEEHLESAHGQWTVGLPAVSAGLVFLS
ncbi:MAG: glycosyl hydrolase family protein [Terriglobia bacterium]